MTNPVVPGRLLLDVRWIHDPDGDGLGFSDSSALPDAAVDDLAAEVGDAVDPVEHADLADSLRPHAVTVASGTAAVVCRGWPEAGHTNEDAAAVFGPCPGLAVLVVADGMGGGPRGHVASATVVKSIAEHLMLLEPDDPVPAQTTRTLVVNALEDADRQIRELGIGAATTAAVAIVHDAEVQTLHVGDSAVLITGQRGLLKLKTVAHSPIGFASESGIMDEAEAMQHPDRHLVSNMVGMAGMSLEIGPKVKLAARDTLILGSDGLFDNLVLDEVIEQARSGPLAASVTAMAQLADQRMHHPEPGLPSKPDDLSIMLYRQHSTSP